ncbi:MAG: hypothetical protein ACRYHQ_03705 [Janthinobacterium lividum]
MTILGYCTTMDEAVVWTDSEVMAASGTHCHFRNKMVVNPLAGAVIIASGWAALAETADRLFAGARDVDEVADLLPKRLRARTIELIDRRYDPQKAAQQRVFLIGHSSFAGRVVGWEFVGDNWFEPEMNARNASPMVTSAPGSGLPSSSDIIAIAGEQMQALRETYPSAQGGMLTVAHIRDGMVMTKALHDLREPRATVEPVAPVLDLVAA